MSLPFHDLRPGFLLRRLAFLLLSALVACSPGAEESPRTQQTPETDDAATGGDGETGDGGSPSSAGGLSSGGGGGTGGAEVAGSGGTLGSGDGVGGDGDAPSSGGAGSGGNPSGSGGSNGAFNPCPPLPESCRVMPSGDSITVGAQSTETGGYRVPLFRLGAAAGKTFTFVGPSGAGPETVDGLAFPDSHDGHSGYIIEPIDTRKGLLPLIGENIENHAPHIVLLMIGTNDINSDIDVPGAPERLARVLDAFIAAAPETLLVVARLIPTRTDALNIKVEAFNDQIEVLVEERASAGHPIELVDMYAAFVEHSGYKDDYLFDGLHPNDAGYALMADVWWEAIEQYLK